MPLRNPWVGSWAAHTDHTHTRRSTPFSARGHSPLEGLSRPRPREGRTIHDPQIPSKIDGWVRLMRATMQASGV